MMRGAVPIVVLVAGAALAGCNSVSDLVSEDPEKMLVLTVEPGSILADGASTADVRARIPSGTPEAERVITFSTSAGTFVDGNIVSSLPIDVEADVRGVAVVQLRSTPVPGSALVQAKAGSFVRTRRVFFTTAIPDRIDVTADKFVVHVLASETAAVVATLRRGQGFATAGTPVQFSATDPQGAAVGGFASITASDPNGQATAVFSPGITSYRGDVTIRAAVLDPGSGATVEGETTVQIAD